MPPQPAIHISEIVLVLSVVTLVSSGVAAWVSLATKSAVNSLELRMLERLTDKYATKEELRSCRAGFNPPPAEVLEMPQGRRPRHA